MSTVDIRVFEQNGSFISIGIGSQATAISDGAKLLQTVLKCLMTTPGIDIFNPEWGSGMIAALPAIGSTNPNNTEAILSEVAASVLKAESQILASQTQSSVNANPDELLQALTLQSVTYDVSATAWKVALNVTSKSGRVNVANVQV